MKLRHTAARQSVSWPSASRDRGHASRPQASAAGFTLFEVLVAMVVVGILFAITIPSLKYFGTTNRISAEVNGLLGDMQYARMQAIQEGQTVTICSSSTGTSCSASNSWQNGWIVFMDTNGNQTVDAGETVLRVQSAFSSTDTLVASNAISGVTFSREGFALGLPGTVTLALHDSTNNHAWTRCLAVSIVGQLTTQVYGAGNCT